MGEQGEGSAELVPADLLRRALKNHDAIAGALRTGMTSGRLFRAIDDMKAIKSEAADLGCYPRASDVLRSSSDGPTTQRGPATC